MLKKSLLRLLLALFALVAGMGSTVLYNTLRFSSRQITVAPITPFEVSQQSVDHFCKSLQYKTISYGDSTLFDPTAFSGFIHFLEDTYPKTHQQLKREIVNNYSLLFEWEGSDTSLLPIILMGHIDVVPIDETTRSKWKADPFGGQILNDTIWGRGAVDDKINVISLLEAVEKMLSEGYRTKRTIFLSFGHDEEITGQKGAKKIAEKLAARHVKAEFVMDEGGLLVDGVLPKGLAALIGTAEKGFMSVELTATGQGGHSSTPAHDTAIDLLNNAISTLRNAPNPPQFTQPIHDFMARLGPELSWSQRMAFANQWLFAPLIVRQYDKDPKTSALLHTTVVPTIIHAGFKDNVIPAEAKAVLNYRLLPNESSAMVLAKIQTLLHNDPRITIRPLNGINEPSRVSSVNEWGYRVMEKTIKQILPTVPVSPFLLPGATDSHHFEDITKNTYRHIPAQMFGYHDINERISVKDYQRCVVFYHQLIKNINE